MFVKDVNFEGQDFALAIAKQIQRFIWAHVSEKTIHDELERLLIKADPSWTVKREVVLGPRERIDLLVSEPGQNVGIEVKVKGSPQKVLEQLRRYARHPQIDALILVTTKASLVNLEMESLSEERTLPLLFVHLQPF
jgi:hypothetical protein